MQQWISGLGHSKTDRNRTGTEPRPVPSLDAIIQSDIVIIIAWPTPRQDNRDVRPPLGADVIIQFISGSVLSYGQPAKPELIQPQQGPLRCDSESRLGLRSSNSESRLGTVIPSRTTMSAIFQTSDPHWRRPAARAVQGAAGPRPTDADGTGGSNLKPELSVTGSPSVGGGCARFN